MTNNNSSLRNYYPPKRPQYPTGNETLLLTTLFLPFTNRWPAFVDAHEYSDLQSEDLVRIISLIGYAWEGWLYIVVSDSHSTGGLFEPLQ